MRTQEGKIAMFRTVTSVALAVSSILGSAAVARVDEVPTQIVHFADLDLTNPEGVKVLQRRVSQAIFAVCGSWGSAKCGFQPGSVLSGGTARATSRPCECRS
jgi:UrcA family protein